MSSDTVIRVESLSKQYRLGLVGTGTLSHDLNRWWCRVRGKPDPTLKVTESNDRSHRGHSEYVWALRDINFEVKRGEVLGIIGRNGAGKSTLLKILSRVTAPTEGQIKIKGRLAALLEVGTGFHPELTGRENIYLNGAILGMTKAEITRKLDEIVDFSGCERYIDTPVKRYSSGMMVRLGFAVAAHLEPEILIVDEVLAVGDAEFQKKCLGKMQDVATGGRTVLFVSHNMASVRMLCHRGVVLGEGMVTFACASAEEAVQFYLDQSREAVDVPVELRHDREGSGEARVASFAVQDAGSGAALATIQPGSRVAFRVHVQARTTLHSPVVCFGLYDGNGIQLAHFNTHTNFPSMRPIEGEAVFECLVERFPLNAGTYYVNIAVLNDGRIADRVPNATRIQVLVGDFYGWGRPSPPQVGAVFVPHTWSAHAID